MSDARLRELQRRWRTSSSAEDLEAYARELDRSGEGETSWLLRVDHGLGEDTLRTRLEAGEITLERLRLGAWLGHAGAQRLAKAKRSSEKIRDLTDPKVQVTNWWRAVQRQFSSDFTDHALVELARALLPVYEEARTNRRKQPFDDRLLKAVNAAAGRLEEEPWETRDQVLVAARAAKQAEWDARGVERAEQVAGLVLCVTGALGGGPAPGEGRSWDGQPYYAPWRKAIALVAYVFEPKQLVRGLRLALLPWALGEEPYAPSEGKDPEDPW